MDKSCTFNPLDPNSGGSNNNRTNSFDPLNCNKGNPNAVQSILACDQTENARTLLEGLADQANNLYGLDVLYYRQDFEPKLAHPIYGDQNSEFLGPYLLKAYVVVNSDASLLTQFGLENSNDVDIQISYEEWGKVFGGVTPQAGDKFEIKDLLCNRPSGFTRVLFDVVSQGDSDLFEASRRWFVSGQRSDNTWLPNEPREIVDDQVVSDAIVGEIDMNNNPVEENSSTNVLERDIDEVASQDLRNTNDEVYGGYYDDGIYFDEDDA